MRIQSEEDVSTSGPCVDVDVEDWATRQHRDFEHGSPEFLFDVKGGGIVGPFP